jgi:hypothetical protein
LRRSDIIFILVFATLLCLIWWNRAKPAEAQAMFYGPGVIGDGAIEPPPLVGPQPVIMPAPPPPIPYASYYDPPPPVIALEPPPEIELGPPPTVVIQQLPPIVMTRTCFRDNFYKGGHRYYHGRTHCTGPEPVPEPEPPE